jgi:hypothetical protein
VSRMYVYRLYVNGKYITTFASYYDIATEASDVYRTAKGYASRYRHYGYLRCELSLSHTPPVAEYADSRKLRHSISRRR